MRQPQEDEALKALVLTYHSHNIFGTAYETNDHLAFASDLGTLTELGTRIVPVTRIARLLSEGRLGGDGDTLVGLTFDDGPLFDIDDFVHPQFGPQRSFVNLMLDFRRDHAGAQPDLCATSFVIASREARRAMERADESYSSIADWLTDAWWPRAYASGVLAIGNHSWDHVHEAPESIVTENQVRGDFAIVDNYRDADREIRVASDFINAAIPRRCETFAFPFGQTNEYLVRDYLPGHRDEHGMSAAFGASDGRAVAPGDSVWNIPRAVCGHHWKSPAELRSLVLGA